LGEVDLAERGLIRCQVRIVDSEAHVGALISERSEPYAMLDTSAELVVKVLVDGAEHGRAHGYSPPREYGKAKSLFAGVDPEDSPHDLHLGPAVATEKKKTGWLSRLLGG